MTLEADYTHQFKKDYRLAVKRGLDISDLDRIIVQLIEEQNLEPKYRDHPLTGNFKGFRECHMAPDRLLLYKIQAPVIVFERTGSHADLFG
jgi:mRNA interferase YafQ